MGDKIGVGVEGLSGMDLTRQTDRWVVYSGAKSGSGHHEAVTWLPARWVEHVEHNFSSDS